jgi:flagellar secretion chaperone FliS
MTMHPSKLSQSYQALAIQTASPGKLVLMLFDGALKFIEASKLGFESPLENLKRNEVIHNNLTKVNNILLELQCSLNLDKGGTLAQTLYDLYTYMVEQLNKANIHKNVNLVLEVERLLKPIRDSWSEMLANPNNPTAN